MWMPLSASADPVVGTAHGLGDKGFGIRHEGSTESTVLIEVKLSDGTLVDTYCIELEVRLRDDAPMIESLWDAFPGPSPSAQHRAQINWIIAHSYPVVAAGALESTLGSEGATLHNGLSEKEAITATQAAIWHFSDDFEPTRPDATANGDADADADVLALYDYLTGPTNVGTPDEPGPALDVKESTATGQAGHPIGPFHVRTTASSYGIDLDDLPAGAKITDADGHALDPADLDDGSAFYVKIPVGTTPGDGDVEVHATAPLGAGRIMVATEYAAHPSQTLIVASSPAFATSETVHLSWTATKITAGTVTLTGHPIVGETVTAKTAGWTPDPVALSYQWQRDGDPIAGANKSTYTLETTDRGHKISVRVTGTVPNSVDAQRTSATVAVTSGALKLSDRSPAAGDSLTVSGTGFAPSSEYAMELRSAPVDLGRVRTNAAGQFSTKIAIPSGFDPGAHHIVLTAGSGAVAASVSLDVHAAAAADTGADSASPLPDTGGPPLGLLVIAGTLIMAGFLVLRLRPLATRTGSGRHLGS